MKYVRQFWIILLISAMGEALHVLITASCTCKCVRTGDHADRTGNTHYQVGTGQRSS